MNEIKDADPQPDQDSAQVENNAHRILTRGLYTLAGTMLCVVGPFGSHLSSISPDASTAAGLVGLAITLRGLYLFALDRATRMQTKADSSPPIDQAYIERAQQELRALRLLRDK